MVADNNVEKAAEVVRTYWGAIHYAVAKACGLEVRQMSGVTALNILIEVLVDLRRKWDDAPTRIKTRTRRTR